MNSHAHLHRVVELNEGAKAVLWESQQVSLRALDAVVRSSRAGAALRGFVEVSSQMRQWSRELHAAIQEVSRMIAALVDTVSGLVRQERMVRLLDAAAVGAKRGSAIVQARDVAEEVAEQLRAKFSSLRRATSLVLGDLQQLGMMASVLSRAALIEAASGDADERRALSALATDFAKRSEQVTSILRGMLARHLENDS